MPTDVERDGALLAPPELRRVVMRQLVGKGLRPRPTGMSVSPRRGLGRANAVLDRRTERWVASCPECPGAEVVPAVGPWLCGSCGAQCKVDWENI